MSTDRSPEWRGISRIDYKHTHGWFARVYLKGKRVKSKLFSDGLHDGRESALEKARKWRDTEKADLAPEDKPKKVRYLKNPPKSNTSGRVGISKTFTRSKRDKNEKLWCFSVTWAPTPGKPKNRSFYFSIYGTEEAAFEAACEFRATKERELDGIELSKEEREKLLQENLDRIMAYFENAPAHRHDRLRELHAMILNEFPDVTMWMKSMHPCYQREEHWIMINNCQRSISIQFYPAEDFAAFLPDHPKSMIRETCVHYRDTTEWRIDELRMLVRKVLGDPGVVQRHEPTDAEQARQKEKAQPEPAKRPGKIKGRARITKAIRLYIEDAPEERQSVLLDLHSLIVDACPIVGLSIQNGIPAYENNGSWMILNNLKKGISLAVSNSDALAAFAAKHPELISGNRGLTFTKTTDIPISDFQELARNVLNSAPAQPAKAPETPAVPIAAKKVETSPTPKRQLGLPIKSPVFIRQGLPVLNMPDPIEGYMCTIEQPRQDRLRALHAMIVEAFPLLKQSIKFRMPTYEGRTMWMSIGDQHGGISIHVKGGVGIEEFVAKYPNVKFMKTWFNLTDDVSIPTSDIQNLIQQVFGPTEIPASEANAKINAAKTPQAPVQASVDEEELPESLKLVMDYITACPIIRQQRLLLLHTFILEECPQIQMSLRLGMPTYEFGERWVAIANQRNYVALYVGDHKSLADFITAHPDIKSGKTCVNFVDGDQIPLLDIQAVIRKALRFKTITFKVA